MAGVRAYPRTDCAAPGLEAVLSGASGGAGRAAATPNAVMASMGRAVQRVMSCGRVPTLSDVSVGIDEAEAFGIG